MENLNIKKIFTDGLKHSWGFNVLEPKDLRPKDRKNPMLKTMAIFNFLGKIPFVGTVSAAIKFTVGSIALVVSAVALPILVMKKKNEAANLTSGFIGLAITGLPFNLLEAIPVLGTILHIKMRNNPKDNN